MIRFRRAFALALDTVEDVSHADAVLAALRTLRFDGASGPVAFDNRTLDRLPAGVGFVVKNVRYDNATQSIEMPDVLSLSFDPHDPAADRVVAMSEEPIRFPGGSEEAPADVTTNPIECAPGHVRTLMKTGLSTCRVRSGTG